MERLFMFSSADSLWQLHNSKDETLIHWPQKRPERVASTAIQQECNIVLGQLLTHHYKLQPTVYCHTIQSQTITQSSTKWSSCYKEEVLVGALQYKKKKTNVESKQQWASLINNMIDDRSCRLPSKPTQTISMMLVQSADKITQSEVHIINNTS